MFSELMFRLCVMSRASHLSHIGLRCSWANRHTQTSPLYRYRCRRSHRDSTDSRQHLQQQQHHRNDHSSVPLFSPRGKLVLSSSISILTLSLMFLLKLPSRNKLYTCVCLHPHINVLHIVVVN